MPYVALKNVIRFANPALVMKGVLDLFLAQPLGAKSLMQRIFGLALNDGINSTQKIIEPLKVKIHDPILCQKVKNFAEANDHVKEVLREEAEADEIDLLVVLLRTDIIEPELQSEQIGKITNAWVAWNNAVNNVSHIKPRRNKSCN